MLRKLSKYFWGIFLAIVIFLLVFALVLLVTEVQDFLFILKEFFEGLSGY